MGFQVYLSNTRLSEVITRPRPCPMVLGRACIIISFPAFPATRTMKLERSNLPSGFFNYSILKLTFLDSKHSKQAASSASKVDVIPCKLNRCHPFKSSHIDNAIDATC